MEVVLLTSPVFLPDEAELLAAALRAGAWRVHLRKPGCSERQLGALIDRIPQEWRARLSLHDHFGLVRTYPEVGLHLNGRNPEPLLGYRGVISRSCHSLDEVSEWKEKCRYVFLSPIFNSISKQGYDAAFTSWQLEVARQAGVIDRRVIALGGVSVEKIPQARAWGFGGVALMGTVWTQCHTAAEVFRVISLATCQ